MCSDIASLQPATVGLLSPIERLRRSVLCMATHENRSCTETASMQMMISPRRGLRRLHNRLYSSYQSSVCVCVCVCVLCCMHQLSRAVCSSYQEQCVCVYVCAAAVRSSVCVCMCVQQLSGAVLRPASSDLWRSIRSQKGRSRAAA